MNRRNRNKSRSERGKPTFKATAKAKAFSPRKTRLSKIDKKKLVETVKSDVAESSKSKPKEKKPGNATTQTTMNMRLTEHAAGITEYISKHEGFSAIIKQRYSDFHVNEIDCDGNVVTLTTLQPPVAAVAEPKEDVEEYLKTTLPEEQYKKFMELVDSNGEEVKIEATEMSKDDRRKLHTAIVKYGKSRLISNTVEKDGKKYIVVKRSSKAGKQERRGTPWPADRGGEYVHFVLHKENMDTIETVNLIASRLRVKPNMVTYAGMKDRRAKTSQLMCVHKVEPQRLVGLSRSLRGIELGNYSFHQRPLRLGDLRGNRFRIVLRNVTGSDKQIEEGLTSLKTKGFLNYYGLQRFGSSLAVPTYEIGKALLLGNWQKAVELILKPRDGEPLRFLAEARKVWWETRDAAKAIKILRNKDKMIEGKLLLGLSQHGPKNYLGALDTIPRNTRLMYLHAYQSLIWNKIVSRRMQKYGLQPIAGDLVLQGEEKAEPVELLEVGDHDATTTQQTSETADDHVSNRQKPSVRILSEKDLKDFTIYDVVLPLPGHDIVYPQNETKEWFEELLQADGLSPAKLKQSVRTYSVGGAYRRIAVRPTNVSWKIMHYSDPQTTLMLSDLEEMQKVPPPEDEKDGAYKALILDFCLPSSTYATMAIREVLKSDTSCYSQALLNDYHVPTGTNGTPKRRLSSAENGDSVSSTQSEDVKMETQEQVTANKHQGSSICTRATKREKKTAEPDGQMEIESMPGGKTPETSTSKIGDKDEPSSEVTTETAIVLPLGPLPQNDKMMPMDVDKNEQQLPTPMECGVVPESGLTGNSTSGVEEDIAKVEDVGKCELNTTQMSPLIPDADSVTHEHLPAPTCAATDKQEFVETQLELAQDLADVAGKKEISEKTSSISDISEESTVCCKVDNIKDGSHAELTTESTAPSCIEAVLPSKVLSENADTLHEQHLSRPPETTAESKPEMALGEQKVQDAVPLEEITAGIGAAPLEHQCDEANSLVAKKSPISSDKSENEKAECKNIIVGTSVSLEAALSPSESGVVSEGMSQETDERTVISDAMVKASNTSDSEAKCDSVPDMTQTEETVSQKSKKTDSESPPQTRVHQTEGRSELLTESENAFPITSDATKKLADIQTQVEEVKVAEVSTANPSVAAALSSPKAEDVNVELKKEHTETELPSSEAEQIDLCTETKELSNDSVDKTRSLTATDMNKLSDADTPLVSLSLNTDMQESEAPNSPAVKCETGVAPARDPISMEQDCEGKRKLTEESSSELAVKSKMIKQKVADIPSVLECKKPLIMVECIQGDTSPNLKQSVDGLKTLIEPESTSSSVNGSSEIVEDSVPQLNSQCPVPEEVETPCNSESETSARSKLVLTTEMVEKEQTSVLQMAKTDGVEQPLKESDIQNVKISCIESEEKVASQEAALEKTEETLQSSEELTSSDLGCEESPAKEGDDDDDDKISQLSGRASVNKESENVSNTLSETSLIEMAAKKEISDGESTSQNFVADKNKDAVEHTPVFVPEKTDSETTKTEAADQSSDHPDTSEHFVKEKNIEKAAELCKASQHFKGSELSSVKEDGQKSTKQNELHDTRTDADNALLLSTSIQPSIKVCEEKVTENSESSSGTAVNHCSSSSLPEQPQPAIKCVNSEADGSSCGKEGAEKDHTHSPTTDTFTTESASDLQPQIKHIVNRETDSERTEVSIKRKVGECENETETSPKKVKVDVYESVTLSHISDAQCSRSPESLKRKSTNDDTEINDQESNTEKKKLKVEPSE